MPIIPILIIFSAFAIFWLYEKAKTKNIKALSLSLISLLFSLSLTHSRTIEGYLAPYIYPDGFCIQRGDDVIIRDDSGLLYGKEVYLLQSPTDCIKKELLITEELSRFKEAVLSLISMYPHKDSQTSELILEVNGREKKIRILPVSTYSCYRAYISLDWLFQGRNTFILRPETMFAHPFEIKVDTRYCFGRSYFHDHQNGEWKRKDGEYMIRLVLKPKRSVEGCISEGVFYRKRGMYERAISEFCQALEINSKSADAYYNLGVTYEEIGMLNDAIKEYERTIELEVEKDRLVKTYGRLAKVYCARGMWDKGLENFRKIVEIDPTCIPAHNNIGLVYLKKGMLNKAIFQFQKVLELDPYNSYAKKMLEKIEKILDENKGVSVK
jgi:tetratricopeptide (TPR) repeat protein